MGLKWSDEEVGLLKDLYLNLGLSLSEIVPIFNEKYNRSDESIKVKIKRLRLRHNDEQIKNIKSRLNSGDKNGMFGKSSPLKGLNKENSILIKLKSESLSKTRKRMFNEGLLPDNKGEKNPMFGKIPWNYGLNKYNTQSILISSQKQSKKRKEDWIKKTPKEKQEIIVRLNRIMIQTKSPTKIETKMSDFLKKENVEFIKNHAIGVFLVDFYLPNHNLVIECDGDYWHANPDFVKDKELTKAQLRSIDRDKRKNEELIKKGIKFLRFWEKDINYNFDEVKLTIKKIWSNSNFFIYLYHGANTKN
jgi:very-short-patch-repair endonuclease